MGNPRSDPGDLEVDRALRAIPERVTSEDHLDDALLIAHHHGRLPAPQADAADAHLAMCRDCRDLLAAIAAVPSAVPPIPRSGDGGAAVIPLSRRRAPIAIVATLMAAAAALVLFLRTPTVEPPPAYTVAAFSGMVEEVRGAPSEAPKGKAVFTPHGRVVLSARPDTALSGPIEAAALVVRGEQVLRADRFLRIGEGGGVALTGPAAEILGAPGEAKLVLLLATDRRAIERFDVATLAGPSGERDGVRWLSFDVALLE
jgi:hypothetical protein